MGTISAGSTTISKIAVGASNIAKVSLGLVEIWSAGTRYFEDFNRANGALGSNWLPASPAPQIASNAAQNSTTSGNTPQLVEYAGGVLYTDRYDVTATVKTPTGTSMVSSTYFYVLGRCTGTGVQDDDIVMLVGAGASLTSGIYTRSASGTFTRQQPITGGWTTGQTATLRCDGNVYTAYRAGVQVAQWVDSGGIVPVNASHRGFGFGTQPYLSGRGFAIDEIGAEDL